MAHWTSYRRSSISFMFMIGTFPGMYNSGFVNTSVNGRYLVVKTRNPDGLFKAPCPKKGDLSSTWSGLRCSDGVCTSGGGYLDTSCAVYQLFIGRSLALQ